MATEMIRQPIRTGMKAYLDYGPKQLDPYVLPLMKGYLGVDKFIFGGLDRLNEATRNEALIAKYGPSVRMAMSRLWGQKHEDERMAVRGGR